MRILTLNTWKCDGAYRQRLAAMVRGLSAWQPDVVLLQEAFATDDGHADTARHLAQALGMIATVAPARHKVRVFEGHHCPSRSGLALLTREPPPAHHVLQLPSDPADGERIAQLARLVHQGQTFWMANVHLTHLSHASALRAQQLATTLAALHRLAGASPMVVGGDFNSGPGHTEIDGLRDAPWHLCNPFDGLAKTTHRTDDGRDLDLDHLLLSGWPSNAVRHAAVVLDPRDAAAGPAASDHAAVMLDLDGPPSGA
jgi:endonuclease/exonuclease/phosphatase family metal-dependent hydrolase